MKRTQAIELPEEEIAKQKEWMAAFAALEDRPHTYCVVTYGCQMNAHDSEKLEGMLTQMGMTPAANREEADFVIFNTCCVRDNAQRRALGNVVWLKELKKTRPELMVGVCGCMMQQPGMGEQILKQYPFVDLAFGTHNLYRFAQLMLKAVQSRRREYNSVQLFFLHLFYSGIDISAYSRNAQILSKLQKLKCPSSASGADHSMLWKFLQ